MTIPILDLNPQYQSLKTEIQAAIDRVLESGRFIMGPDVQRFEEEVAEYLGVKHAIGVNSGTDALAIALKALEIGQGDEVITTPFSFIATAESISNVSAKPIFADIDPQTFNINPKEIEAKITANTKAIMPVHLYGQPAAMGEILEIARRYELKVIEDVAQAFGAKYSGQYLGCEQASSETIPTEIRGKRAGTIGDVGAYSFFPSKNLGAYGDGGLIATNDDEVAEKARMLRVHGAKKKYHNEILGYNSRLDTLQAAILRVKLPYIDSWNQRRYEVARRYNELLADTADIIAPALVEGHVFHQYTIRILNDKRDFVREYLAEQEIKTMIYYPIAQDCLPIYQGQYPENPISQRMTREVLSLPIWPEIEDRAIDKVVQTLKRALKNDNF